jgi:hypothetical protein
MSLFQCDNCGCVENTALTFGYIGWTRKDGWQAEEREQRGLAIGGKYCSVCWGGEWHGRFERQFFVKGKLHTDHNGNINPPDYQKFLVQEAL